MGSRVRFFGAGVAVSALCFLLASMTWQYVLGLFVLASVGWGFWSWVAELEKDRERARAERAERNARNDRNERSEIVEPADSRDGTELIERTIARKRRAPQTRTTRGEGGAGIRTNIYQFPLRERLDGERSGRSEAAE